MNLHVSQPPPHGIPSPAAPAFQKVEPRVSVSELFSPRQVAQKWLDDFSSIATHCDVSQLQTIFHSESWWRDHLALDQDFHTIHGLKDITSFLGPRLGAAQLHSFQLAKSGQFSPNVSSPREGLEWIESMFSFETKIGSGKGMLRLVIGNDAVYKCYAIYLSLQELKGFEASIGDRRPHGGNNSLLGGLSQGNWLERKHRSISFQDADPTSLVIGAGQAGLNIGARLQALNLSCLIIDKNARVGDNWRKRYRSLVTHDPVQYTHMYGLPFPRSWPLFTPKDKLGDWFEAYASVMELNVWTSTKLISATYSHDSKLWTVDLVRGDGTVRVLKPKHIIFCTGHAGEPRIPTFPNQSAFAGSLYHGSQHQDASSIVLPDGSSVAGKKVVVVGTGNSGHDISQNYHESGANVTMLQRGGTYVLQASTGLLMLHEGLYDETGPPTEDADIYAQSLPIPVQFELNVGLTARVAAAEKENLQGLTRAGFKIDLGSDGSGIYRKYITRGGGYYIDIGGSKLIVDGKIKVEQSEGGIKNFEKDGLVLADGRKLEADVIVLATGYDNMRTTLRKVMGNKVADRAKDVWDLDAEGEVNAMWRPSGHPRLWYMGGSLALCRIYSGHLALQIKAIEEGLYKE